MLLQAATGLVIALAATPLLLLITRHCSRTLLTRRHVMVVLVAAVMAGAAMALWPPQLWAPAAALLLLAVPAAAIDGLEKRLPDSLTYSLAAAVLVAMVVTSIVTGTGHVGRAVLAGLALAGALTIMYVVTRTPAPGDLKYALGLGMVLGWAGWIPLIQGASLAIFLMGLVALGLRATRRLARSDSLPLGPAMLAATLFVTTMAVAA